MLSYLLLPSLFLSSIFSFIIYFHLDRGQYIEFGHGESYRVYLLYLSLGPNCPQGQYQELDVVYETFDEFCGIVKRRGENKEASRQYTLKNKHMSHAFHQS